jgi:hypothetical protein
LHHLGQNGSITLSKFRKLAKIPSHKAEAILANLLIIKVLIMKASEKGFSYELNPDEKDIINQYQNNPLYEKP